MFRAFNALGLCLILSTHMVGHNHLLPKFQRYNISLDTLSMNIVCIHTLIYIKLKNKSCKRKIKKITSCPLIQPVMTGISISGECDWYLLLKIKKSLYCVLLMQDDHKMCISVLILDLDTNKYVFLSKMC